LPFGSEPTAEHTQSHTYTHAADSKEEVIVAAKKRRKRKKKLDSMAGLDSDQPQVFFTWTLGPFFGL
jgi:hypothetical protein